METLNLLKELGYQLHPTTDHELLNIDSDLGGIVD